MNKKLRTRRANINIGRWASYAAAGAATALAANNDSEAAGVYYSGLLNVTVSPGHGFKMDILSHGHSGLAFPGAYEIGVLSCRTGNGLGDDVIDKPAYAHLAGSINPHLVGFNSKGPNATYQDASKLAAGVHISARHFTSFNGDNQVYLASHQAPAGLSQWRSAGTGFLGFEFKNTVSNTEVYGWARITTTDSGASYTLIDYAIGSPGVALTTGQGVFPEWTGATDTTWANTANWSTGVVPGSTSSTTDTDTALFDQNAAHSPLTIDLNRNLQNITFDNSAGLLTTSLTIGTTSGNALLLTSGGTIQITLSVANAQTVNAPLVIEGTGGTYTFSSNATAVAATLNFGGAITAGSAGATTLILAGTNTGANTISGPIGNGVSGATMALSVQGGDWAVSAVNTYSGPTTLAGGQLTVSGSGSIANTSLVSISNGAVLELASSTSALGATIDVANNSSAANGLEIAAMNQVVGTVTGSGNTVIASSSSLTAYQIRQSSLSIGAGSTVTLVPSGTGSTTHPSNPNNVNFSSSLSSLTIAGGMNAWTGTLDIGNNGLVIAYGSSTDPYSTIDNMINSGYNGGVWGGTGITSSIAAAAIHTSTPLNIGLLDFTPGAGNYSNTTFLVFEGQTVTTNAILVRLTYMDDLVLAGDTAQNDATSDALLFAANYGTGTTWAVGDLTHDGAIDSNDALLFAANYVVGLASLDGTTGGEVSLGGIAAVPEPASLGMLAIGAAGLLAMRRVRKRKSRLEADCSTTVELLVPDLESGTVLPLAAYVGRE